MDGADLAGVIATGQGLSVDKLVFVSVHFLWIYDYFLTLGDEIHYAWSGSKSRLFALFIAIRYTPAPYIIWVFTMLFHYSKSFCQDTKWALFSYTTTITTLAQIVVALRIYAVTGKKRVLGGVLTTMIAAQFLVAIYYIVRLAMGPIQEFPDIDLDPYKFCIYKVRTRSLELVFTFQIISFDLFSFAMIVVAAKKPGMRYPGIPSLLDTILRDATWYFILIFACQLCLLFFLFFAPGQVQILPGVANILFIPIMASRLMLSLKKASVKPIGPWYFSTMCNPASTGSPEDGTLRFALQTLGVPHSDPPTSSETD